MHQRHSYVLLNKLYSIFIRLLIAVAVCSCSIQGRAQISANFDADKTQGCSPVLVRFFDRSTGGPTSWFWDLGNGITSTQQNPTSFYFNPGVYNVKLVVRKPGAVDSIVKSQFITVYFSPAIAFTANDTVGCVPMVVQFSNQTIAGSGTISNWNWDVGDGTTYNLQSPIHTYNVAGTFTVTLQATNSFGCVKTISKTNYITVRERITANFNFAGGTVCRAPATIAFTNTSSSNTPLTYQWNFGDGTTSTQAALTHVYSTAGNYPVKLFIRNATGCVDSIIKTISVSFDAGTASIVAPPSVCEKDTVRFINASTPATTAALWNFGDGTTSTDINPIKTYQLPGTYAVKLINMNGTCSDTTTRSIIVKPKPSPAFTSVLPPPGCLLPVSASFSSTAPNIAAYAWNFGDGGTGSNATVVHSYSTHGSFSVTLVVTGTNGCVDSLQKPQLLVLAPAAINGFIGLPYRGCLPFNGVISASISTPDPVATYLWDFGDGTTSNLPSPSHTYNASGSFTVKLNITTLTGCTAQYTMNDAVVVNQKPTPSFNATPVNACANELVQFTDQSTGTITDWVWDFGDQSSSTLQNPIHHYGDTGYFTVKLTVYNVYCFDTISLRNYIYIKPPIAKFSKAFNCSAPFVRQFTDLSIAPQNWLWNFGDGNTSTAQNPTHTYALPGIYTVKLTVQNGNCTDEKTDTLRIAQGYSDYTSSDTMICHQTLATFTALQPNPDIVNYSWNFGNGNTASVTTSTVTNVYTSSNTYATSLVTTDALGCTYQVNHPIAISVLGPKASFTNPPGTCVSSGITFTENSTLHPLYALVSRVWDFGDGTVINAATNITNHIYSSAGNYNVKLVVRDAYGCVDSITKLQAVNITNPIAAFTIADTVRCTNNGIKFLQNAQGLNLNYSWLFGDGSTSPLANPVHSYTAQGSYPVTLTVTDQYGCINTLTKPFGVRIADPVASFNLPDTNRTCPPFIAVLSNTSSNYSSLLWDFDNGSFSTNDTPTHFFNNAGIYNIKLTVQGYGNCTSTATKRLVIQGPRGTMSYNPLALCAPGVANFSATAINTDSYIWDFGDGNTVTTFTPATTHMYTNAGTYAPRLILFDSGGCAVPVLGLQEIVVSKVDANIDSIAPAFCDSATVFFTHSSVANNDVLTGFAWNFGNGNTATGPAPTQFYTSPGNYTVQLIATSSKGCKDTATKAVKIVAKPRIAIVGGASVCINQPITFQAQVTLPDTSQLQLIWTFGNGNTDTSRNPAPQQFSSPGNYQIKVVATNSSGCVDSVIRTLVVHPLPVVNAGADSIICIGQSIVLQPSGASTYVWQSNPTLSCTNCTNPSANPTAQANQYIVTGTSAAGCIASDTIAITVVQRFAVSISKTDTICAGKSTQLIASGADQYTWTPAAGLSNPLIANPVASPATSTVYTVFGRDYRNCFVDSATVPIVVYPVPVFSIVNNNISVAAGTPVTIKTLNSPDITRWRWTPINGLSCFDCPEPTFIAARNITYKAVVTNTGGCSAQASVEVTVICNNGNIYIPNTFSPNKDGMNDVFYIRGKGLNSVKSFRVFSRWGAVVFEKVNLVANDPSGGWDGLYNNQPAPTDVYIYEVEVICENNQVIKLKGNVTLVK